MIELTDDKQIMLSLNIKFQEYYNRLAAMPKELWNPHHVVKYVALNRLLKYGFVDIEILARDIKDGGYTVSLEMFRHAVGVINDHNDGQLQRYDQTG